MNTKFVILEEDEATKIHSEIKEIKEIVSQKFQNYPLPERWLNVVETCEILSVSKRSLQQLRDNGKISFSQINAKIYFKASDIQKYLEDNYNGN
jgi:hypothetical protein